MKDMAVMAAGKPTKGRWTRQSLGIAAAACAVIVGELLLGAALNALYLVGPSFNDDTARAAASKAATWMLIVAGVLAALGAALGGLRMWLAHRARASAHQLPAHISASGAQAAGAPTTSVPLPPQGFLRRLFCAPRRPAAGNQPTPSRRGVATAVNVVYFLALGVVGLLALVAVIPVAMSLAQGFYSAALPVVHVPNPGLSVADLQALSGPVISTAALMAWCLAMACALALVIAPHLTMGRPPRNTQGADTPTR